MIHILHYTPWLWLAVTVICIVIESLTFSLTTIWFAISAFIMVFLSFTPLAFPIQLLVFVLLAAAMLFFTRPAALRKFQHRSATNSDSIIGKKVTLLTAISAQEKGTVKISGVVWSVKAEKEDSIPAGTECTVTAIEGNTLVVIPDGVMPQNG